MWCAQTHLEPDADGGLETPRTLALATGALALVLDGATEVEGRADVVDGAEVVDGAADVLGCATETPES